MYFEIHILVICNNHEVGVLMNENVRCVEKYCKNSGCMHVKCNYVIAVVWNNFAIIKFHLYQSSFILSAHTVTTWI